MKNVDEKLATIFNQTMMKSDGKKIKFELKQDKHPRVHTHTQARAKLLNKLFEE